MLLPVPLPPSTLTRDPCGLPLPLSFTNARSDEQPRAAVACMVRKEFCGKDVGVASRLLELDSNHARPRS